MFDREFYINRNKEIAVHLYGDLLDENKKVRGTDIWFDDAWRLHQGSKEEVAETASEGKSSSCQASEPLDSTEHIGRVMMFFQVVSEVKLPEYHRKHGGKRPARIFISSSLRSEIDTWMKWNGHIQVQGPGRETLFGIPVSVFPSEDGKLEVYLSEEEEEK